MFEAMLVSLGTFSLLKAEDTGRIHPSESYQVPDFRVVLPDGGQWLIEVKNAYFENPVRQEGKFMTRAYRVKLENYAAATGGQLKLAIYWARWSIWTLVSPQRLTDANGDIKLDLKTALFNNELGYLGDRMVGTRSPLKLRLEADHASRQSLDSNGTIEFTIADVRVYSGDVEILDPSEKEIAWIFMRFGDWKECEPFPIFEENQLTAIEFQWKSKECTNKGLEPIGFLSRMFCRYYSEHTVVNQEVTQLNAPLRPGWLAPLVSSDFESKGLALFRSRILPRYETLDPIGSQDH